MAENDRHFDPLVRITFLPTPQGDIRRFFCFARVSVNFA
jgi:hypothetical protein